MTDDEMLLPAGAVVVHVGPYKTGTSALQMAFHNRREELASHGVCYPGTAYRHMRPSAALLGRSPRGVGKVPMREWQGLVDEVTRAEPARAVISSEAFSSANPEQVARIVSDLGAERVYPVAVCRRLDRLLPSVWQERVKSSNEVRSYTEWLDPVLAQDLDDKPARTFWRAHGLADFLDAWRAVLPPEQVVVIVGDEQDRTLMPRTFERLLGLPTGLLDAEDRPNSSLSWEKIELYRRMNQVFDEQGWSNRDRRKFLQRGMLNGLRDVPATEADVAIPRLDAARSRRVAELSRERAALVRDSGARVIGDPDALLVDVAADAPGELPDEPRTVTVEAAARAIEGVLALALRQESAGATGGREVKK
jgi:hypothetical protein